MLLRIRQLLVKICFWVNSLLVSKLFRCPPHRSRSLRLDWVIPGRLAVGGLPSDRDKTVLLQANIRVLLSLCDAIEGAIPEEMTKSFCCLRFFIPDSRYHENVKVEQLAKAVNLIHECMGKQLPIYVHCLAGVERSPMICIAYLCRFQNLELWEAVNFVKQVHPRTLLNSSQIHVLKEFVKLP